MKLKTLAALSFLLFSFHLSAQEEEIPEEPKINTIEQQFVDVVDESNDYQQYKVIPKAKINELRRNILDSVVALETNIDSLQSEIDTQKNEISELNNNLTTTNEDLAASREKENGIMFLGALIEKSTYNTIMWLIILVLIGLLAFFVYKFKESHKVTKDAQLRLAETEIEFESYRQKALEREQKVRRKLQDEINKGKK